MNFRDYLGVAWRRRWLILVVVGLGAGAVWLVGEPEASLTTYSGSSTLALNDVEAESALFYAVVASETSQITERLSAELGPGYFGDVDTSEFIQDEVKVDSIPEIGLVTIEVEGLAEREHVEVLLEGMSRLVSDFARERRTSARDEPLAALVIQETALLDTVENLQQEIDDLAATQTAQQADLEIVPRDPLLDAQLDANLTTLTRVQADIDALNALDDFGLTPLAPVAAPRISEIPGETLPLDYGARMTLGVLLGAILGVGLAFVLQRFDTKIYNRKDAEQAFRLPVLAEIPKLPRRYRNSDAVITKEEPAAAASEAYRQLRSTLTLHRMKQVRAEGAEHEGGTVILIASPSEETGRSTTAANLAYAGVAAGQKVLLINGDLRYPRVQSFFGLTGGTGLTDTVSAKLDDSGDLDLDRFLCPSGTEGLTLMLHGSSVNNPGEILSHTRAVFVSARKSFDTILVDTPPMLVGNDVSELLPFVDVVLALIRASETTIDEGHWFTETANRLQIPVAGAALIGATSDLKRKRPLSRLSFSPFGIGSRKRKRSLVDRSMETSPVETTTIASGTLEGWAVETAATETTAVSAFLDGKHSEDATDDQPLESWSEDFETTGAIEIVEDPTDEDSDEDSDEGPSGTNDDVTDDDEGGDGHVENPKGNVRLFSPRSA